MKNVAVPLFPSEIVYVNFSVPMKSAAGEYFSVLPSDAIVTTPLLSGVPTAVIVSVSPVSFPDESFASGLSVNCELSSGTVNRSSTATGASFAFCTVTVAVEVAVRFEGSEIV